MRDKVLQFCRRERLTKPGDRVVCAVSGGADSVALLHCLLSLRQELEIEVAAAHYNHCLRGEASDGDEAFVRGLCASWGVPLEVARGDVAAHAAGTGQSVEESARHLRYAFLLEQPGSIAVAHNADDQVETVLLNLLRGTGLRGLCAMAPKGERVIRPLLTVTRAEIEAYLSAHGIPHREDATNEEDEALRNRLRHHVTPLLRQENPDLPNTVARMTELLRQDEAYLEEQTGELLKKSRRDGGYDCRTLREAPAVLRRRALRTLLTIPKPAKIHVDAVETLLRDLRGSACVELPGGFVMRREYGLLRLEQAGTPNTFAPVDLEPGQTARIPGTDWEVSLIGPVILEKSVDSIPTFAVKYDMIGKGCTVTVRPRRTGDCLTLSGGTKSVKKRMIDRKIPAAIRDNLPVLAVGPDILAVYGLGTDVRRAAAPGDRAAIIQIRSRGEKDHDQ